MTGVHLGILMYRRKNPDLPFGKLTSFVDRISNVAAARDVTVSFIAPRERLEHPLPDVLWTHYYRQDPTPFLQWYGEQGVSLFNTSHLTKWRAYQHMKERSSLAVHLPETVLLEDEEPLVDLLSRHERVFIKPISGSVGKGILRARPARDGRIAMEFVSRRTGQPVTEMVTPKQFGLWLEDRQLQGRYLAQQGLELDLSDGRPADVRVLVQKDGTGRWQVTGMGARVAAPGRFTANLHTGGGAVSVPEFLAGAFPGKQLLQNRLLEELARFALSASAHIETETGPLGELGFDVGIDRRGHLWYVEHNHQPGRTIFEQLGRPDLSELAHARPVEYARFLGEQRLQNFPLVHRLKPRG